MKFSIRLLLAVTLLAALLIQASIEKREVELLEARLEYEESNYKKLESKVMSLQQRTEVCRAVLESYEHASDVDLTPKKCFEIAKMRFRVLQLRKANE